MSAEAQRDTINVIRSLIISQKNPTRIPDLLRDYVKVEGCPIPFTKFGYQSLKAFLESSNEFSLITHQGEICITARPIKESAHISKMIASQKKSTKGKNPTKFPSLSRSSNNIWNKSSYSSNIHQIISHNKNTYSTNGYENEKTNQRLQGDFKNNISQNLPSSQKFESNNKNFSTTSHGLKENDLRNKLTAKEQTKQYFDLRSKLDAKIQSESNCDLHINHDAKKFEIPSLLDLKITKLNYVDLNNKNLKTEVFGKTSGTNHSKRIVSMTNDMIKISVQNRLKVYNCSPRLSPPNSTINSPSILSTPSALSIPNQSNKDFNQSFNRINTVDTELNNMQIKENKAIKIGLSGSQFDNSLTPIQSLEQYLRANQPELPKYEEIGDKLSRKVQCRVDPVKFSIYPVWFDSDQKLTAIVYELIRLNNFNGIFVKALPRIFEESCQFLLPDNWISIINDSNQFIMKDEKIFINSEIELKLPWEQKNWYLHITTCISTVEVWARIVGPEYSENLQALFKEIELSMLTNKQRPSSIITGKCYLVYLSACWHRVRLEQMNKNKGTCRCFFIDFGDEDELPVESLYICDSKFLKLPPQAIVFSLFGLEDFDENLIAKQSLNELLMGRWLVAEIKTKKELFYKYCNEEGCSSINTYNKSTKIPKIQIVLYDTSHPLRRIVFNPLILKRIYDGIPIPELKCGVATNVTITHVTDQGDVFLQMRNNDAFYVQTLIHQLVESKFNEDDNKVNLKDIMKPNLFLIKDNEDNKWYRGCLAENQCKSFEENYYVFYVDFGITKLIHVSQIFRLESLSAVLGNFPKQAIKVRLQNIPNINRNIVGRIKSLLPINYPATVKLVDIKLDDNGNSIPYIIAYVRLEHNQSIVNVNEAIKIENELEKGIKINLA